MSTTNTGSLGDSTTKVFYDTMLLRHAEPRLIHQMFSEETEWPANSGDTIEFRIFDALPTEDDTLIEGVSPNPNELGMSKIQASATQGGRTVALTDRVQYTAVDPVMAETTRLQGDQSGRNIDKRFRDVQHAGTSVYRPNDRATRGEIISTDIMTFDLVDRMSTALEDADTPTWPEHGNRYVMQINPNTAYDLRQDPKWKDLVKYNAIDPENRLAGNYLGDTHNVRFVKSTATKDFGLVGSGGIRVHSSLMMGKGYCGHAWLSPLESVFAPPVDALKQISHVGYKYDLAVLIKQDAYGVRAEHACSLKLN